MTPQELKKTIERKKKRLQRNRANWSNNRKLEEQTEIQLLRTIYKEKLRKHGKLEPRTPRSCQAKAAISKRNGNA